MRSFCDGARLGHDKERTSGYTANRGFSIKAEVNQAAFRRVRGGEENREGQV